MVIQYSNTLQDLEEFTKYHYANSPNMKRTNLMLVVGVALVIFLFVGAQHGFEYTQGRLVKALVISAILGGYFLLTSKKRIARSTRKMYSEGQGKGLLCEHELEITDDHLLEKSESGETRTKFPMLYRISETDSYLFIYIGTLMAHVIPKNRITHGDYQEFIQALLEKSQMSVNAK